jgi:hypothetical protein
MPKRDLLDELMAARRLRLALAGVMNERTDVRPLEYVRAPRPVRTAERQEEIDVLEHGAMATRFA